MSTGTPEKLIPRHLDPRKMAHQGAVFKGTIPAGALPRLQDAVAAVRQVAADIQFDVAEEGQRVLHGKLTADVDVECQRCLEPMPMQLSSDFNLAVVWNEAEAKQLPAAYDPWVTGEGEGDLYEILEEELLLSLPVVAFHEGECVNQDLFNSGELPDSKSEQKPNPFQVLQQLKGNIKK